MVHRRFLCTNSGLHWLDGTKNIFKTKMTKMNKYNATKVHTDEGLTFDSKREY